MYWIDIDDKYLDYLREFEKRIPYSDYGTDKMKPFFGVLFDTDKYRYPNSLISRRCLDYKALEDWARGWNDE